MSSFIVYFIIMFGSGLLLGMTPDKAAACAFFCYVIWRLAGLFIK